MNKKFIGYLLSIAIVGIFIYYLLTHLDDFKVLIEVSPVGVALIFLLYFISYAVRSYFYIHLLAPFKHKENFSGGVYSAFMTAFGNYFLPMQSGVGIRAVYMKKKFGLTYLDFLSTISGTFIVTFFITGVMGLIATLVIQQRFSEPFYLLYIIFGVLIISTTALSQMKFSGLIVRLGDKVNIKLLKNIISKINIIIVGWEKIAADKGVLAKLSLNILALSTISALITYVELRTLGVHADFFGIVLYASLASISLLINITPGAIGIKEGLIILFSQAVGINEVQVLQIAVIDRAIVFAVLGLFFLYYQTLGRREFDLGKLQKVAAQDEIKQ